MDKKFIEKASSAISDKYRLSILVEISKRGTLSCSEAQEITGLSQPCVSHHLKLLTDSDLIIATKEGRNINLTLNKDKVKDLSLFLTELL